jgi:hypothetical protein
MVKRREKRSGRRSIFMGDALPKNNIWELTKLPFGEDLIGFKWVYCIKYKVDGLLSKYKARMVEKCFTQ